MEKKIVLIGAGSAQFGYGTIGDILQSKVLEGTHIVLHDINPDTLALVEANGSTVEGSARGVRTVENGLQPIRPMVKEGAMESAFSCVADRSR